MVGAASAGCSTRPDATFNAGGTGVIPTKQTVNSINVLSKLGISYKF
jgi:hypothetical protein